MKIPGRCPLALCFALSFSELEAAQHVELTADIEFAQWPRTLRESLPAIHSRTQTARCLIGTNTWRIEGEFSTGTRRTWVFTGSNIVEHSVIIRALPRIGDALPVGHEWSRAFDSVDGNPGRPVRVIDLLVDVNARLFWLAFCSAPTLKRENRQLFPPSSLWKQVLRAPSGFSDKTTRFEDELGLPRTVDLYTTNAQPIVQYHVSTSTNLIGWNFPLEFHLVQYEPIYGTNAWQVHLTAKGKVTSIRSVDQFQSQKPSHAEDQ